MKSNIFFLAIVSLVVLTSGCVAIDYSIGAPPIETDTSPIETDPPPIETDPSPEYSPAVSDAQVPSQTEQPSLDLEFYAAANRPIVFGSMLLGGSNSGQWVEASEVANDIVGGEVYKLFDMDSYVGLGIGSAVPVCGDHGGGPYTEWVEVMYAGSEFYELAISADWDVIPRRLSRVSDIELVRSILFDYLREQGISNPEVVVVQCYSVDLVGDGEEMIVVSASSPNIDYYEVFSGDFSLAAIIDADGSVQILFEEICRRDYDFGKDFSDYAYLRFLANISSIADLNGDGAMEVIVGWSYYEGNGYEVYSLSDGMASLVLSNSNEV